MPWHREWVPWPRRLRVALPAWRARHVMPAPKSVRGVPAGELQRDFARPNNRAEGPPDMVMDMVHARAGGRRLWRC